MPPFPERESSILAKLKKKKGPGAVSELDEGKKDQNSEINGGVEATPSTAVRPCTLEEQHCSSGFRFGIYSTVQKF